MHQPIPHRWRPAAVSAAAFAVLLATTGGPTLLHLPIATAFQPSPPPPTDSRTDPSALTSSPIQPSKTTASSAATSASSPIGAVPKQTLAFPESRTGVTVHLVGSMHYNPHSVSLSSSVVRSYGDSGSLGSVVVEQCPRRWEKVQSMHPPGSPLRPVLDNEMQAAAEAGERYGVGTVLGDEGIEEVDRRVKEMFVRTLREVADPFGGGWKAIFEDLREAWTEAVDPSLSSAAAAPTTASPGTGNAEEEGESGRAPEYLNAFDLFDPPLLLATPLSFVRYPLAILVKSPLQGVALFALLAFLTVHGPAELLADDAVLLTQESAANIVLDFLGGLGAFVLETVVLSRIFLTVLLVERNVVLARSIREECERLRREGGGRSGGEEDDGEKVCVAVLGMAHCNGVKSLLRR